MKTLPNLHSSFDNIQTASHLHIVAPIAAKNTSTRTIKLTESHKTIYIVCTTKRLP